jgi:alpha-galactosidase
MKGYSRMLGANINRRSALARLLGTAAILPAVGLPARVKAEAAPVPPLSDGTLTLDFDHAMRSRVSHRGVTLTAMEPADALHLADGRTLDDFVLHAVVSQDIGGPHGRGKRTVLQGTCGTWERTLGVTLLDRYPGLALIDTTYRNFGPQAVAVAGWHAVTHDVLARAEGAWSFAGASYPDRRDWLQPVAPDFQQRNYMGMNGSDYGGGTPVAVVWRRDAGLAVGHVETVPHLVSLPVAAQPAGTRIGMQADTAVLLPPGATLALPLTFLMVHGGDHFRPLDAYRRLMAERGLAAAPVPQASYAPIWCAWGYERAFTTDEITATLPKAKSLGLEWAVLDDGWQSSVGDWQVDRAKFPGGDADMKAFAGRIRAEGMLPRLWFSPLAASPGSSLLHDHADMLLLDRDGAAQNVSWWNSYTLCPAYAPTVDYFRGQIRRMIGDWGFAGVKLDGQHLNGVAPCYNPAHKHARPEESYEKLQDFWKALYDEAIAANPDAVVEICPCGDSFAFHNMPAMNNTPASDPESSWQVRLKGKTFKALMGRAAPFSGDHVELSDGHDDFASSYGVGAILSTKFTWPKDTDEPSDKLPLGGFVLTPEKETLWRRWIDLYHRHMLPQGQYQGELYDIAFDKPEAHAVAKDDAMHYAFFAPDWHGPVALRGLSPGQLYALENSFTGESMGRVEGGAAVIQAGFHHALLVRATPVERDHA